jgi:alkylation response protein AidB-like acyl-CoA dehydrogenase
MSEFFYQDGLAPVTNTFEGNRWLKAYLKFKMPKEIFAHVEGDLHRLGELCAGEYLQIARAAEAEEPVQNGNEIQVSKAWRKLHEIAALEGLIAIGYKRAQGEYSRLYQFSKLYLFHPSSAFYTCPLAMADGAARVLEIHGSETLHKEAFSHLTSDSPQEFWTSGQWMTEKAGGSDVGNTGTEARLEDGQMRLYGTKWFSSATTSEMALALARVKGAPAGSRGLTLFLVPLRKADGSLNNIEILRLKEKLGTKALPTAELELKGAAAFQVGGREQGVKTVATMLNITRLYNSVCSAGQMTRALEQLRGYSSKRKVFGKELSSQVLHYGTFAMEELKNLAAFLLTMETAHLVGREECGKAGATDSSLVRLLTPVTKLFTARTSLQVASEVIEGFGGAGYIETTGVAVHLRDAQVFPIWEGATNVLSLDLLRVMGNKAAMQALSDSVCEKLHSVRDPEVKAHCDQLMQTTLTQFVNELGKFESQSDEIKAASSRELAFFLARMYAYVLLLNWAGHAEAGVRKGLMPWIEIYKKAYLGSWKIKEPEALALERAMWDGSLTV